MRFKVIEYEVVNGAEVPIREYKIEPKELTETRQELQKAIYRGIISGFDIKPEVQDDER